MRKKRKTILFVHHTTQIAGAEISLEILVRHINQEKFQAVLFLPDQGPLFQKLKHDFPIYEVPLRRLKKSKSPWIIGTYLANFFFTLPLMIKLIWKIQPDIIHANSTTAMIYAGIVGRLCNKPCIWHVRDRLPMKHLAWLLTKWSTHIICISDYVASFFSETSKAKISIIPNTYIPFKHQEKKHSLRKDLGLKESIQLVAQIGQLVPHKRHEDLIKVAAPLVKEFPKIRFLIIGTDLYGEYSEYIRKIQWQLKELNLAKYFIFMGYRTDIAWIFEQINILVHPSRSEPSGRVILEAMSLGVPVIGIAGCGAQELIKHERTGFVLDPGNSEALRRALFSLLDDTQLAKDMGEKGKEIAIRQFGLGKQISALENLYCAM